MNDFPTADFSSPPPILEAPAVDTPTPPLRMSERKLREVLARHQAELQILAAVAVVMDKLPEDIAQRSDVYNGALDLNQLSREQTVRALAALAAGKWTKKINTLMPECIDYEGEVDGVRVRLWGAAPPESCRVIEFEEVVPATTVKRRRLVCSETPAPLPEKDPL